MTNSLKNKGSLVSIIVPAYNVEKYIEKCVSSIIDQTYTNIEIIVIDDGSTDSTGMQLDKLKDTDDRICIIHKHNAGVSAARNSGLEVASGEYIVFVDGDDYISKDYVEYMLRIVQETGKEFCVSKNYFSRNGDTQVKKETIEILSAEDATCYFLCPSVVVYSPNCIISRRLLDTTGIRFSTTLFYGEGLTFTSTLAQLSGGMGLGNRKVYYYRRNNEMSATTKFNIEKMYNGERALDNIAKNLHIKNKKVYEMLLLHKSVFYLGALARIEANKAKKVYINDYRKWLSFIRNNCLKLMLSRNISVYRKLLLVGGCVSPWLLSKLDIIRRKRIIANSIDGRGQNLN